MRRATSRSGRTAAPLLLLVVVFASQLLPAHLASGAVAASLGNPISQVTGKALRSGGFNSAPDISGQYIVWGAWRAGGGGQGVWAKDLATRDEFKVATVDTYAGASGTVRPKISGNLAVWNEAHFGAPAGLAGKQLPSGATVKLSEGGYDPDVDGSTVVWSEFEGSGTNVRRTTFPSTTSTLVRANAETPAVSGDTIVWREGGVGGLKASRGGVLTDLAADGRDPDVSGDRVVFSQGDSIPQVMSCVLPTCAPTPIAASPLPQRNPRIDGSIVTWEESQLSGLGPKVMVRDLAGPSPTFRLDASAAVDQVGDQFDRNPSVAAGRVAWNSSDGGHPAVYWKSVTDPNPALRASSFGLGEPRWAEGPVASGGSTGRVGFLSTESRLPQRGEAALIHGPSIWATDLSTKRQYRVQSPAGAGSATSRPAISGPRLAWSDTRGCTGPACASAVFTRTTPDGLEGQVSPDAVTGLAPAIDGTRTAWVCSVGICVRDGAGPVTSFPVAPWQFDNTLYLQGDVLVFGRDTGELMALNVLTGQTLKLATPGVSDFVFSGNTAVWTSGFPRTLKRTTVSFPCSAPCDASAAAVTVSSTFDGGQMAFNGTALAWTDSNALMVSKSLSPFVPLEVSASPSGFANSPTFNGDLLYWNAFEQAAAMDLYESTMKVTSVSGTTPLPGTDTAAPGRVTGVQVAKSATSNILSWTNPPDADLFGVRVLRKSGLGRSFSGFADDQAVVVFEGLSTTAEDVDVVSGVDYTYAIYAFDAMPNISPATLSTAAPGAPTGVVAVAGNAQATVSWSAPASDGGSPITGYTVTSSPGGQTCSWTTGPLSCTVSGLLNGTSYTFTVAATNAAGTGPASAASSAVVPAALVVAPSAPTAVAAVGGNGQATVSWAAPASNGGSAVTGYTVTSSPGGHTCTWSTGPLSCTVSGLSNGTSYTFTVVATNTAGTSPASPASNPVVPAVLGVAFHSLTPSRVLDPRPAGPQVGPYSTPWAPGQARQVTVAGTGGVPSGAAAVVLNVTVTGTTGAGYLTIWPTGQAQPLASSLNWAAGQTIPNAVTVVVGTGGNISVFNSTGNTNVIVDVVGYYDSNPGGGFTSLTPARIQDSRPAGPQVGPYNTPWSANQTREVTVTGVGGVSANADAVVVNVTVTGTTAAGYLTIWPTGQPRPVASSLNWAAGQTIPNAVTVKVGQGGRISVFNAVGDAHVIIDVVGSFSTGTGSLFHPLAPARIQDSRPAGPQVGPYNTPWGPETPRDVQVTGSGGIPTGATSVLLNVTVTATTAASYLTIWPAGQPAPLASSLNWAPGDTIPNAVTTKLSNSGTITIKNATGNTHIIADAAGWYG